MASPEIERAWRLSGLRDRDVSPHLAFVQGYEAATVAKAETEGDCDVD